MTGYMVIEFVSGNLCHSFTSIESVVRDHMVSQLVFNNFVS